jgi:hypothetical protein
MGGMDRREQMRRWLALREERGLTFGELSRRTGVPRGTLGHWAWKLRREDARGSDARRRGFVELVAQDGGPGAPAEPSGSRIEIVLEGGRRVVVSGDFVEAALERVLRVLARC